MRTSRTPVLTLLCVLGLAVHTLAGDTLEAQETLDRPIRAEWKTLSGLSRDDRAAKAYLRDITREYGIPALALAIVGPGRAVFLSEGSCDPLGRRAVTDKTVFRASRLGMLVFNYLVLRLEGEGILKLELPLAAYFGGAPPPDPEFAALASDPRWDRLTARQILVHKDGLGMDPNSGERPFFVGDPGRDFRFSDDGYRLLQHAIEIRTGRGLNALAREFVFEPIGMPGSSFDWAAAGERDSAFAPTALPALAYGEERIRPDAARSFLTCTNDMARFIQTVYRRGFRLTEQNLLGIETAAALVTSRTITGSPGTAAAMLLRKGIYWSLLGGHFESPWPGVGDPYFCPGREAGCENYLIGFPARSLTFILLSVPGRAGFYVREILKELIGDVYSPWGWLEYE